MPFCEAVLMHGKIPSAMRKWLIFALLGATMHLQGYACDLCNMYLGINPQFNNNQVGIRMRLRMAAGLHSHVHTDGGNTPHSHEGTEVRDTWISSEVYARIYLNPKWVVFATVPYAVNLQQEDTAGTTVVTGLGDVPLVLQRQLFNLPGKDTNDLQQRMFLGGGIKIPLGKFDLTAVSDPHLQAGTGSWDGILAATYIAQWRKFGLSADCNVRLSTTNRQGYRFAHRFNATASLFYSLSAKNWTLMPTLGAYSETASLDSHDGVYQNSTGGLAIFGTAGFEAYHKRLALALNAQLPAYQNLNGTQPANQLRLMTSVGIGF